MKHLRLFLALFTLIIGGASANAQTNFVAGWDGGNDTSSPSNFGWSSSANRTLQPRNNNGGIRMTTNYSGYKLEDGTSYSYSATSDPSSVIFWVRYNTAGESFTYTFQGLEPDHYYDFSALVGWHNNSNAPTFTIKINDGTNDLATITKTVSAKQTLYPVSARFKTSSTMTNTTNVKIVFTCNQTNDCMEAISAMKLTEVVIKDELQKALTYANRVNTTLNNSTLATEISSALDIYDDTSATQEQVDNAKTALNDAVITALSSAAPEDMTFVIENPGFESSEAITENHATGTTIDYSTTGWTALSTSTANSCGAVVPYGSSFTLNNVTAPSADNNNATGNALGISIGWSTTVAYQSSAITLPAGTYTITVYGYNNNNSGSNFTSKNGFIPTSGSSSLSSKTSFTYSQWETDVITFTLTEPTSGVIQIGGTAANNTSTSHAKVFFDNITLNYENPLAAAITAWNTAHETLENLDATALPDAAEAVITTELAKSRPETQSEIEAATTALQALIDSYSDIKNAYDDYKALKAKVEDLKNTSKYTFTGAEALSTFNSTLSTIDDEAEVSTDAATLTALLPDLKTAGNNFVANIESSDGFDLTYNVTNNSFETGALSPWTTNGSNDTGVKPNSNGTYTTTGVDGDYLFNTWNNGNGSKVSQNLTNLPKGYYTVTALAASDAGNKITIIAGASTKEIDSDATNGKTQFVEGTTDKALVSDGTLEIGANSSKWYKVDNFRLTYYTETSGARDAWLAAKAAAEAARDNTDYANVTGVEKTALLAEIAKTEPTTPEAYGTATTALQEATTTFIAAKESYDALSVQRTTAASYTTEAWPYASAAKKTVLDDAIAAEPTDAEDAVAKANAIITAYRQFVESNGLAEGVEGSIDYTSTYLAGADPDTDTGWTNKINVDNRNDEKYTDGNGNISGKYYDGGWSTNAGVNINMTRELSLPAGEYLLQITARGSVDLTLYKMSIGEESVDLPKDGGGVEVGTFGHGWSDKYIVFESDGTPQTLTIAATSDNYQQWISFNRLRLVRLNATLATTEDYENLNTAISAAEDKVLGFENGEYAPYNNVNVLTKLAEAKAIDQNANNVKKDIQALTAYLNDNDNWSANDEEVNAVHNGLFATVQGGDNYPEGWTRTNAWGQMQSDLQGDYATAYYNQPGSLQYGNNGVYTMPLKANTTYTLKFAYRSHENNSNKGITISVLNGEDGISGETFPANGSTSEWKTATLAFTTGAAGDYLLTLANNGNTWMTGVEIFKAKPETVTIKTGFTGTTYSSEYPLDFSSAEGLKAYIITDAADGQCTTTEVTKVPAGTGVYVEGDPADYTVNVYGGRDYSDVGGNLLVGTGANPVELQSSASVTYYMFGKQNGKESFFKVGTETKRTASAHKAYLAIPGVSNAKAFVIVRPNDDVVSEDGGFADGINSVEQDGSYAKIYNLNGQRVNNAQKGIYIKNGKKVIIK